MLKFFAKYYYKNIIIDLNYKYKINFKKYYELTIINLKNKYGNVCFISVLFSLIIVKTAKI